MGQIEFRNISKDFPGVKALKNINFKIDEGEVIAFLGENGAGKSTLLKIMSGDYQPSCGQIYLNSELVTFSEPKEAIEKGIGVIYQERQILMELSVAENIFIGIIPTKNGLIDKKNLYEQTKDILKKFNMDINPNIKVKNLSIAYQQMIEIIKIYLRNPKVIAFDEPTASLSSKEIDILFNLIEQMKKEKKIIIYVTHRMNEIDKIADKIAIFKDGTLVDVVKKESVSRFELIKKMVGREINDIYPDKRKNIDKTSPLLEAKSLKNINIKNINFKLYPGEVLGFAGLVGAGRTEVMKVLFGIDKLDSGEIYLDNIPYKPKSPKDAINHGIGLCPEDRKTEGIIPELSVLYNTTLAILPKLVNGLFISENQENTIVEKNIKDLNIKTPHRLKKIVELSGGNQQKVILGRWLETNPKVLILDEPTKGIDIGAKSEFYNLINECAKKNMGIIVVSSELPEILGICDRILVMKDGEIKKELIAKETSEEEILNYAMIERSEVC
ncbi:MAG: sugar ABC transporter ATP-binding protein [Cetobacterium sp.]|uniref:sugar ABC transporter ATP-binding protein n=1 Tax=Cetobacterium sp. TaxID=2071632 RepID=UPI002FCABFB8